MTSGGKSTAPSGQKPGTITQAEYEAYLEEQMEALTTLAEKGATMPVKGELKYDKDGNPYIPYSVPEAYYDENASLFSHAECEEVPITDTQATGTTNMFLCKVPVGKAGQQKAAKTEDDEGWGDGEWGLFTGFSGGVAVGGAILLGIGCFPIGAAMLIGGGGAAIYGALQMGDDPAEADAAEGGEASKGEGAADSKKAEEAEEAKAPEDDAGKETWGGKLVIDIEGTSKNLEYVSESTDIKYQLKEQSKEYNKDESSPEIKKEMQIFASQTAKKIAGPGERVTWDIQAFDYAYNLHAQMKSQGLGVGDVKQDVFNEFGWATVTYGKDDSQKLVNVFTGKVKGEKGADGGKKATPASNKGKGGKNKVGGKKKGGSKKKSSGHGIKGL
jgi:hypothetical protein